MKLKQIFSVVVIITTCDCAKILGIFSIPSKSHHILGESLLKALAFKGHDVVMLSPFTSNNIPKNYKEIVAPEVLQFKEERMSHSVLQDTESSMWVQTLNLLQAFAAIQDIFLNSTNVQNLINSKEQYDLAIVTYFGNDAVLALAQHVAKHTIILSTVGSNFAITKITKAPAPISYIPIIFSPFINEMSFFERTINLFLSILSQVFGCLSEHNNQKVINKYFLNAPSVKEIHDNISLVLLNSNNFIDGSKPYVPTMIQVGGLHVEKPKPLSKDLQDFMDNAKEGVIFFSLGSNVKLSDMDDTIIKQILRCFSKLPYRVLWKFEKKNFTDLPKNVKISKWLPQRDILAHKNLKLFITHGGLLSITEALYNGVPMIGIPMFADQWANVRNCVFKGFSVELAFKHLSEETLTNAILEVITNPRYRESAQAGSQLIKDQPIEPLDTAVYWIEYVLRHNGAHHLKTSAIKLNIFQEYLIDVIAVVSLFLCVILYLIYRLCKLLCSLLCQKFVKQNRKHNKKSKTL